MQKQANHGETPRCLVQPREYRPAEIHNLIDRSELNLNNCSIGVYLPPLADEDGVPINGQSEFAFTD